MRIFITFLFLMTSFVIAQECSISSCESSTGFSCINENNSIYSLSNTSDEPDWDYYDIYKYFNIGEGVTTSNYKKTSDWCASIDTDFRGDKRTLSACIPSHERKYKQSKSFFCSIDKPVEPKQCDFEYCSSADKRRFQLIGDWYETCETSYSQVVSRQTLNGNYSYTTRFGCREPAKSVDVCYALYSEPKECNPDDELAPDDESTSPTDDKEVPCFGNVEGCSEGLPPDYVDPGTGIPCWGDKCNEATPPDYIDPETGTPCWGKNCGLTPPTDSGSNGDGTGTNDGNGTGVGTGNGGQGDGGIGSGDGNGSGNWDVPGGGWVPSETFDIPKTFWEQQNKETIKDKYDREVKIKNPYDFTTINTDIGLGTCPKFEFEYFGDISPPCSLWELLGKFFSFSATLFAFMIVFWRR